MAEVDYARLSYEELKKAIEEEESYLATLKADLTSAQARKAEIEAAIATERLPVFEERTKKRAERIRRYERAVAELEAQIRRFEDRIRGRSEEIRRLEARVKELEARLTSPYISPVERYITRETITRLTKTLAGLRAWQTRDTRYLEFIRSVYEHNRRVLASLRGWQVREIPLVTRLEQLQTALAVTTAEMERLKTEIAAEERRLTEKRKFLPKFFKAHIVLSAQYPGKKLFEIHVILNSLSEDPYATHKEMIEDLAYELLRRYDLSPILLGMLEIIYGEIQVKPVAKFNEKTEALIVDIKYGVTRIAFEIAWRYNKEEKTIEWTDITEIAKKSIGELKEYYEKMIGEEAKE